MKVLRTFRMSHVHQPCVQGGNLKWLQSNFVRTLKLNVRSTSGCSLLFCWGSVGVVCSWIGASCQKIPPVQSEVAHERAERALCFQLPLGPGSPQSLPFGKPRIDLQKLQILPWRGGLRKTHQTFGTICRWGTRLRWYL